MLGPFLVCVQEGTVGAPHTGMVLKNSKWDKQAKHKYLKKHGLLRQQQPEAPLAPTPKWSAKARPAADGEDLSDWDEEDEEILDEMFPQLGGDSLTKEQREKVKRQILQELLEKQEQDAQAAAEAHRHQYDDGIYLGTPAPLQQGALPEVPTTLEQFISKDISASKKTNRKLPKHKLNEDLLAEYGITLYTDTVKHGGVVEYNNLYKAKQQHRPLSKIPTEELVGFRIGHDQLGQSRTVEPGGMQELTEEEKRQNQQMEESSRQAAFLRSIRARFDDNKPERRSKVLEINNLDASDRQQVDNMEKRWLKPGREEPQSEEDDLEQLLGSLNVRPGVADLGLSSEHADSAERVVMSSPSQQWLQKSDVDSLLSDLATANELYVTTEQRRVGGFVGTPPRSSQPRHLPPTTDDEFLDELLG